MSDDDEQDEQPERRVRALTPAEVAPAFSDRRGEDRRKQNIPVAVDRRVGDRRKGGRPRRDDARRRRIRVNLSDDEIVKLRQVAKDNHMTQAAFARDALSIAIEDCSERGRLRKDTPYKPKP
jgi:hypothetical protein